MGAGKSVSFARLEGREQRRRLIWFGSNREFSSHFSFAAALGWRTWVSIWGEILQVGSYPTVYTVGVFPNYQTAIEPSRDSVQIYR